ncbi:hypothetical protein COEREDRAFT_79424 [Coemansia reversa NRRL 1564]|uniref:Invertebrate defensins family profile domain-containing protein n=1 Tax=Coemansia reversa (strain ATCC 12441 / NRRL 1564) TaxID=763665 RepID=A0A2G5BIM9_COERN|nr:hypothetical protein COEREDRAFT_79424 [Coemansia reversa NRRL 1564]|eukprot:PIA18880.1 hypothetical protein COEREDRAFT_79424 [Coemansia reversa NRRL 1564]
MKAFGFLVTICAVAISAAALPTSNVLPLAKTPFEKCVAEHGGEFFPYPGPGECSVIGRCQCLDNGSVGCIC